MLILLGDFGPHRVVACACGLGVAHCRCGIQRTLWGWPLTGGTNNGRGEEGRIGRLRSKYGQGETIAQRGGEMTERATGGGGAEWGPEAADPG